MTNDVLSVNKAAVLAHFSALESGDFSVLPIVHADSGRNHAQSPFDTSNWAPEGFPSDRTRFRGHSSGCVGGCQT